LLHPACGEGWRRRRAVSDLSVDGLLGTLRVRRAHPIDERTPALGGISADLARSSSPMSTNPVVHRQPPYASSDGPDLPRTTDLANRVVTLPIWPEMDDTVVDTVAEVLARLHDHAGDMRRPGRLAG